MIVTCTSCQARFRIPDERIGPKGAKVRCSKCKNVFVVRPGPATDAPADPFAGRPAAPDPFAAGHGPAAPTADPFAAPPDSDRFAPADPFAAPPAGLPGSAPFAPAAPPSDPSGDGLHLPVTDLSDLALGAAVPPAGLAALAPPLPATAPPPGAPPEPGAAVTSADDLVLEEPSRAIRVAPPPPLPPAPIFDLGGGADLAEPGLPEAPRPDARFEFGAPGTFLSDPAEPVPGLEMGLPASQLPGGAELGADPFAAAALEAPGAQASSGEPAGSRLPTVTEPLPPEKALEPAPPRLSIPVRRKPGAAREAGPLSTPVPRSRVQGFLANAVSLAALLAVAAGLLSWWLRDATPARTAPGSGPVVATGVLSGLYDTAAGPPLLFVRGEVRSRTAGRLGRVAVRAEVVLGGEVVARAEGLAGAVPGAEEVAQVASPEDAARLRARVASRAPAHLDPGGSLPFLVVFDAVPDGFRDAVFRVVAEPLRGGTARAP
jgi:predicted Zn finger-like uncharacterized protein